MDFIALEVLILKLKSILQLLRIANRTLVILGNITEDNKQETQCLIAHPVQKVKYASYVIKWIAEELAADEIIIMPGDNDLHKYKGKTIISLIKEELEKLDTNTKIVNEGQVIKIGEKKVMLYHTIEELSRKDTGESIESKLKNIGADLINSGKYNTDILVCGQYHIFIMTPELIFLPSFQWSNNPMYGTKGCILITDNGLIIPVILKQMTDYNSPETVDELDSWLHNIKQKVLDTRKHEKIRLCIDYKGYRKSRRLTRGLYKKIKLMLEAGLSSRAIARKLGIDPTVVRFVKNGYRC